MARAVPFVCGVVLFAMVLPVCVAAESAAGRSKAVSDGVTVDDVIKLNNAGFSEDIIVQQIRKRGHAFDLSTDQLIALKNAHVSDGVLKIMLNPALADVPVAAAMAAQTVPEPAPVIAAAPEATVRPVASASVHSEAALPTDIGIYLKNGSQWIEVPPELVYWKTGGAMKMMATARIVHGDVNGHVVGASSHTIAPGKAEFLIVSPDGVALTEYQLVRLRCNHGNREFRTVTGGILHSQGGAIRDSAPFDGEKVAGHVYLVRFPANQGSGEYGFLPPGSNTGSGKIYSFRLGE